MSERYEQLIQRLSNHPLKGLLKGALEASEKLTDRAAAIQNNKFLSDDGRAKESRAQLKAALRDVRDAGIPIDEMRSRLKDIRASIRPVSFDKGDLAGALARQEIRAYVRTLPLGERAALLVGEKAEAMFVDAILEQPGALSGLDSNLYDRIREQRLEALHTNENFQAEELTREIAEASAALQVAKQGLQRASGMKDHEFEQLATEVFSKRAAPWLKHDSVNGNPTIIIVPLRGGPSRPATPDEIRDGKFYRDLAEYQADRAA
jgi:hypothetical protein